MKIICTQENLKMGLAAVSRIITSSNTLPILNNLLLKTENGLLKLSSTNLEISIHTLVRCKVEKEGEACVPAKIFAELVNTLPSRNITLTVGEGSLKVQVEQHSAVVKTLPSDDFPSIPIVESSNRFNFSGNELKEAFEAVIFAASTNETQPEISGVFLKSNRDGCIFVATDRYRLAEKKMPIQPEAGTFESFILPLKTSHEITKLVGGFSGTIEVVVGDNQVLFTIGDTSVISRIIDGQYPDYEQIIPREFKTTVQVHRIEILGALRTSSIFSQGSNSVKLTVSAETAQVSIASGSQDLGESVVNVNAQINGPSVHVLFNHRYILDMLNASRAEDIIIKINSDSLPVVFSEAGNDNYLYLVMPIKN